MVSWDFGVSEELAMVEETIAKTILSDEPILTDISSYVIGAGGKRLRPTVTLLAFKAVGGKDIRKAVDIAAALELIHNATLIHDDINDGGRLRRGRLAAYRKFGVHHALVTGDFLFTKAFLLGGRFGGQIVEIAAEACVGVAEGEMRQKKHARDLSLTKEEYIDIISRKTAWLISGGAKLGAILGGGGWDEVAALGEYGVNLGIAFQITDDVLDVGGDARELGKPVGVDLQEGNLTLVTILATRDGSSTKRDLQELLGKPRKTRGDVSRGLKLIEATDAVARARDEARGYALRAKEDLAILPQSPYKLELMKLADFVVERRS